MKRDTAITALAIKLLAALLWSTTPVFAEEPLSTWNWYFAFPVSPFPESRPETFWGKGEVVMDRQGLRISLEDAKSPDFPGEFSGILTESGRIEGVMSGLLMEDPREMQGHYWKETTWPGSCTVEVIVLGERERRENLLVLRRSSPWLLVPGIIGQALVGMRRETHRFEPAFCALDRALA